MVGTRTLTSHLSVDQRAIALDFFDGGEAHQVHAAGEDVYGAFTELCKAMGIRGDPVVKMLRQEVF